MNRPEGVCHNCYVVFRATKPKPVAAWCWHSRTLAYPTPTGWRLEHPGDVTLKRLRAEGEL